MRLLTTKANEQTNLDNYALTILYEKNNPSTTISALSLTVIP